jgi:hypothetical protein
MVAMMSMLMLLLGGGGNQLLDYIPSDAYWKAKEIEMTAPAIAADLQSLSADDASKATAIRRLMAIRTLGELKDKSAVEALQKLTDSKEMFVADYANRAIANIEGKPMAAARPDNSAEMREKDLWTLPQNCGAVAQVAPQSTGVIDIKKQLAAMPKMPGVPNENAQQMTQHVIDFAEQLGNVRIDCITLGVADEVGENSGFVVILARGQYDRQAVKNMVPPNMMKTVNDVEAIDLGGGGIVALPSDDLIVLSGGAPGKSPDEEIVTSVKEGKGKLAENEDMKKLIDAADRKSPLWATVRVTDSYKQAPVLASFDSVQLTGKPTAGNTALNVKATGADADSVKGAVDQLKELIEQAKQNLTQNGKPVPGTKTFLDFLNSIQTSADGTTATVSATVKGSPLGALMMPALMGGGFHAAAEVGN